MTTAATPPSPPSPTRRDDRLALATIAIGAATALLGIRAPVTLVTGVALGLAGVLLAVRGDRPISGARLMTAALVVAVVATTAVAVLGLYEEWIVGQRLAEGAAPGYVMATMRPYARARAALESFALFASLSMLLAAIATRVAGTNPTSGK